MVGGNGGWDEKNAFNLEGSINSSVHVKEYLFAALVFVKISGRQSMFPPALIDAKSSEIAVREKFLVWHERVDSFSVHLFYVHSL